MLQAYSGPCAPVGTAYVPARLTRQKIIMAQPCCPGSTANPATQTCELSYTTGYMASGPGVSFSVQQTCNHNNTCDNGYQEVGTYTSLCYERKKNWAWDPPAISAAGKVCAEPNPESKCPAIGTIRSGNYVSSTGGAAQGITNVSDVRLQCNYSSIANPFDQMAINAFTGPGASDLATIQTAWCDAKNYSDMSSGPCVGFYTTRGDYDLQQVIRIQSENPNGEWINNSGYLSIVQQVATGSSSAGSSVTGKQTAQNMISNYCLVQNPSGWVDNDTIRAIINSWALQNAANIGDDCRLVAAGIVNQFCQANPGSSHCDCYNATQFGTNIFNACQGNTTGACTDINNLATSFAVAPAIFAPQIASLKSYITPNCAVGACVSAATSAVSPYLPPSPLTSLACQSDIQVCLQSVKVGGSVAPGATINQNCSTTIGIGGTVPSDPPPPGSNKGFQNIQAVQTGDTLTAGASPDGSVSAGTPGGGLSQSDNTRKYVLAATGAGAGLLGFASSIIFLLIIVIGAILIFGKSEPAPPPVIPLAAYGL